MDASGIVALLGRKASDPSVKDLLEALSIPQPPEVELDEEDGTTILDPWDWLANRHLGVELGFEDEGTFLGLHPEDQGGGEMLLTEVWFFGDHPERQPFPGLLPLRLDLADDRPAVRHKLSAWEPHRRSWSLDTWDLPPCRVTVAYAGDGSRISFVRFARYRPRQHADSEDADLVRAVQELASFLGAPLSDDRVQSLIRRGGLARDFDPSAGMMVADQSERVGASLQFRHLAGGREPVLAQVKFLSDVNLDTVCWPGALPFGLTFDDSPERAIARVPTPPAHLVELEDGSFIAHATWNFSRFTLFVEFSTMENLILSVRIIAPGVRTET